MEDLFLQKKFHTLDEAYLTQYSCIKEAREAIRAYIKTYNFERCHSAINYHVPAEMYFPSMLLDAAKEAA